MQIDYSKIFPDNVSDSISLEQLREIKEIAQTERERLNRMFTRYANYYSEVISNKASEFAYCSARMQDKSNFVKAFVAANIVFTDEKFASILSNTDNFINKELLSSYLHILAYLKAKITSGANLTERDKASERKALAVTFKLVSHFKKYIGKVSPEVIINKISEILAFRPELIDNKVDKIASTNSASHNIKFSQIPELEYVYYTVSVVNGERLVTYNYVLNSDSVVSSLSSLMTLISINQEIMDAFKSEKVKFEFRTLTTDTFNDESIATQGANLSNVHIVYSSASKKDTKIKNKK